MWVYGSGFPKSHNIAKQLDKLAGVKGEIIGEKTGKGYSSQQEKNLAHGFREYKDGLPYEHADLNEYALASDEAKQWDGWGTALKPAHEPMVLARKPLEGTVANNVLTFGTGGLNIDGSRVGSEVMPASTGEALSNGKYGDKVWDTPEKTGRFPANFIHDGSDEVVALFPDTKGFGRRGVGKGTDIVTVFGSGLNSPTTEPMYNDSGSAARFFYCAKASKRDRNEGLDGFDGKEIGAKGNGLARKCATCSASVIDGCACPDRTFINPTRANHHPTVKPTTLMQYLVRLVTPPNGIVLDPFMGSGSTGKACAYEGFEFIGIDQSAEYVAIAQARIDFALADKSDELPL
jgi:site-specific DNA-methyltransferase (adenine-specific)